MHNDEMLNGLLWEQAQHDPGVFQIIIRSIGKQPKAIYGLLVLTPCYSGDAAGGRLRPTFNRHTGRILIPYAVSDAAKIRCNPQDRLERDIAIRNAKALGNTDDPAHVQTFIQDFLGLDTVHEEFRKLLAMQKGMRFELNMHTPENAPIQSASLNFSPLGNTGEGFHPDAIRTARYFASNFHHIFTHVDFLPYA